MKKTVHGFTLMEVMIVVMIIGILSAIAIPSYQRSVDRSRRADAQAALIGLASYMERRYTENNSYCDNGAVVVIGCGTGTGDTGAPSGYSTSVPTDGGTAYYNLLITAVDRTSFTVTAQRTGVMAGDDCGNFTLNSIGVKGVVDGTNCWGD